MPSANHSAWNSPTIRSRLYLRVCRVPSATVNMFMDYVFMSDKINLTLAVGLERGKIYIAHRPVIMVELAIHLRQTNLQRTGKSAMFETWAAGFLPPATNLPISPFGRSMLWGMHPPDLQAMMFAISMHCKTCQRQHPTGPSYLCTR